MCVYGMGFAHKVVVAQWGGVAYKWWDFSKNTGQKGCCMKAYLDNNATTPLKPEVQKAMVDAIALYGNPSSAHQMGQQARMATDNARRDVAQAFNVRPEQVVFTSGGSEANNLALRGYFAKNPDKALIISSVEHSCVHQTALALHEDFGIKVHMLPVDQNGVIDLDDFDKALGKMDVGMVSVMHANNETGVFQPIQALVERLEAHPALLHVDAVQTAGKIPVDFATLGADMMTISFHKMGGPKGVGAAILHPRIGLSAHITGGTQERSRRAGTENTLAIIGAGACAAGACKSIEHMAQTTRPLRDFMEAEIKKLANDLIIVGEAAQRVPNTCNLILPHTEAETAVMLLDLAGYAVSTGSACSSGKVSPSRVVLALGYSPEQALRALRISLGWQTTKEDVVGFVAALKKVLEQTKVATAS